jgi:hypothetical protein
LLIKACENCSFDSAAQIVQLLIDANADFSPTQRGVMPFMVACLKVFFFFSFLFL